LIASPIASRRSFVLAGTLAAIAPAYAGGDPTAAPNRASAAVSIPVAGRHLSGREIRARTKPSKGLIVAIHGGGYTSKYFDTPGQSALELVARLGYDVVAIDRPGYGSNADWILGFDEQVAILQDAVDWAVGRYGTPAGQVFLYGHSIGGMLSLLMANASPHRYSGVHMTGSGAVYHERAFEGLSARIADPATGTHSMSPQAARRAVFMAPVGGWDDAVARLDPERDVPSVVAELRDALQWPQRLRTEAGRARVPVQFVVPQYDGLWRADADAMQGLDALFAGAPFSDVYVQRGAGHSVELHRLYRAHVLRMAAFADECRLLGGHKRG